MKATIKYDKIKIEQGEYLYIKLHDNFIIEGIPDYKDSEYIHYWIFNDNYGIKQHIIGIKKDFDIIKYLKNNLKYIIYDYEECMNED